MMIEPKDKVMGFMYQLLGFSMLFVSVPKLYEIQLTTRWYFNGWVHSTPPFWYKLTLLFFFVCGVISLCYGISKFIECKWEYQSSLDDFLIKG